MKARGPITIQNLFLFLGIGYLVLFPIILQTLITSRDALLSSSISLIRIQTDLRQTANSPLPDRIQVVRNLAEFLERNQTLHNTAKIDGDFNALLIRMTRILANRATATEEIEILAQLADAMSLRLEDESDLQGRSVDVILVIMIIILGISLVISLSLLDQLQSEKRKRLWDSETTKQLLHYEEDLRFRLSRDLHDDVAQTLAMAKLKSNSDAKPHIHTAIEKIRALSRDLSLPRVTGQGFTQQIEHLVETYRDAGDFELLLGLTGSPMAYQDPHINSQLIRIIQECLQNAQKHSRARQVSISLRSTRQEIIFQYSDDGVGLGDHSENTSNPAAQGSGMKNIRDRIQIIRGTMSFGTNSQGGVRIQAIIPIKEL
ncbi:sensor histidine kinase [Spirochaeta lutea]|uniref:histidine kinase n=1 Tax=Spirochaeta lutea TaxID=1480694 RepID=A0A098R108_9SPIO|nr:ATP-binding protein [Spirochaeta lutea]KGE73456.1 hypothetical protein DC28_03480 [Spirochaeta lutea]